MTEVHFYQPEVPLSISIDRVGGRAMTGEDKALVERLRGHSEIMTRDKGKFVRFIDVAICTEAADRIEALEAENERLREALVQADLKIRSFPGADQSDVEFIRAALGETQ